MSELSKSQKEVFEELVDLTATLITMKRGGVAALRAHAILNGTDHEDGLKVDSLVENILQVIEDDLV